MWLANQIAAFSMAMLITNISEPAEEPTYASQGILSHIILDIRGWSGCP